MIAIPARIRNDIAMSIMTAMNMDMDMDMDIGQKRGLDQNIEFLPKVQNYLHSEMLLTNGVTR